MDMSSRNHLGRQVNASCNFKAHFQVFVSLNTILECKSLLKQPNEKLSGGERLSLLSAEVICYVIYHASGSPYLFVPSVPTRKPNSTNGQREISGTKSNRQKKPVLFRSCARLMFIIMDV